MKPLLSLYGPFSALLRSGLPLGLAALLLLLMAFLIGPGNIHAAPQAGSLTVALNQDLESLDPAVTTDQNAMLLANQIYDTLTVYEPGGGLPVPSLALTWTYSTDYITWTFTLRPGVTFHDGEVLDAAAVKFNVERWWDPANPYHTGEFPYFEGLFGLKGPDSLLADITTSGDDQVIFHLSRPYSPLAFILANPAFSIASPAAIQAGGTSPVGSGPFKFTSRIPGESVNLEANPGYWGHPPYLDSLTFKIYETQEAVFAAIQSGGAQAAYDLPDSYTAQVEADPDLRLTWQPMLNTGYLGINRGRGPLAEPLVRQAIAHAIDKQVILSSFYDPVDEVAEQFLPPLLWGFDPTLEDYAYDPALARDLLAQAGYTDGFTTTLIYRDVYRIYLHQPGPVAQAIAQDLAAVGIQAQVQEIDPAVMVDRVMNGDVDLFLLGWGADYPHPNNFFYDNLCTGLVNGFGPRDDALCNDLEAALAEPDPATQGSMYRAASRRVHDTLPMVPLAHGNTMLVVRSTVAGLETATFGGEAYENVFYAAGPNVIVDPDGEATLLANGEQVSATIQIPAQAVTREVILAYAAASSEEAPSGLEGAGGAFDLMAYEDSALLPGLAFGRPVAITMGYGDIAALLDENTLNLYIWNDGGWVGAAGTCNPAGLVQRDLPAKTLTVPVCQTGRFALFGVQVKFPIFLPAIRQ